MRDFDINSGELTRKALIAVKTAILSAGEMGHNYIGTEHLLLGIALDPTSAGGGILKRRGVRADSIKEKIITLVGSSDKTVPTAEAFTPAVKRCLRLAKRSAEDISHTSAGTEHILCGILSQQNSTARTVLGELGCNITRLYTACSEAIEASANVSEQKQTKPKPQYLEKYGFDMVQRAKDVGFDPCIGRDEELMRLESILIRRHKNNPCILGEAGVGKTAIVEALASKIAAGNVPDVLANVSIYSLNMATLLAGAKYRGDFEERLKLCIEDAKDPSVILFIDEFHTLCGAGGAEGAIDAGNILKPMLARGELRIIGATTYDEYMQSVEKDKALARRFCTLRVNEPTCEQTVKMLTSLKSKYEAYHSVTISDEAIISAVELSHKHIPDRRLPDKAIDLLDDACSSVKLKSFTNSESSRARLSEMFSGYLSGKISKDDYFSELSQHVADDMSECVVTGSDVSSILALQENVSNRQLTSQSIDEIGERLSKKILGQSAAIASCISLLKRSYLGFERDSKPFASMLFSGTTGVGKTVLATLLAKELFGDDALVRLDMTEFSEAHTVSRVIGAPAGYIGHGNGGELTEKLRRKPRSLLLVDEFEKAHPDVKALFLQILDNGKLTDSLGRVASFDQAVVIFTTNALPSNSIGFGEKSQAVCRLSNSFSKELLNRIDTVCAFNTIDYDTAVDIANNELFGIKQRCLAKGASLTYSDQVAEYIAANSDYKTFGVRDLQRTISKEIEAPLCDLLPQGAKDILCTVESGKLALNANITQTA